jgi:hypothetical protein
MQTHHIGIELDENRDTPDHGLHGNTQADTEREPKESGATTAHADNQDEGGEGGQDKNEGQHAIRKLNDAVNAHFGRIDKGILCAERPGGTTQSARRESDCSTRDNNSNIEGEIDPAKDTNGSCDLGGNPTKKSLSNHCSLFGLMSHVPAGTGRLRCSSAIDISGFSMMSVGAVAMGNLSDVATKSENAGV